MFWRTLRPLAFWRWIWRLMVGTRALLLAFFVERTIACCGAGSGGRSAEAEGVLERWCFPKARLFAGQREIILSSQEQFLEEGVKYVWTYYWCTFCSPTHVTQCEAHSDLCESRVTSTRTPMTRNALNFAQAYWRDLQQSSRELRAQGGHAARGTPMAETCLDQKWKTLKMLIKTPKYITKVFQNILSFYFRAS